MELIINSIDYSGSIVDGPGVRTVLYVQGCKRHCKNCQNPSTWNITDGIRVETKAIASEIIQGSINKKLTISGGEPLLQYDAVLDLIKQLPGFDIALYTGFELENVPSEIHEYLNYIKVGNFISEKRTTISPYIGSTNQRFIDLREHL